MAIITIDPKTVNGATAVFLELRIIAYPLDSSALQMYYAYLDSDYLLLDYGNFNLPGSLISSATNTALTNALTAEVGSVTYARLDIRQLYSRRHYFRYTKTSGYKARILIEGDLFSTATDDAIKSAAFTALGVEENTNDAPVASSVVATGGFFQDNIIIISYTYSDTEGDLES